MEVHGHVHAFAELPAYMKELKDNDTHSTYYLEPTPDSFEEFIMPIHCFKRFLFVPSISKEVSPHLFHVAVFKNKTIY